MRVYFFILTFCLLCLTNCSNVDANKKTPAIEENIVQESRLPDLFFIDKYIKKDVMPTGDTVKGMFKYVNTGAGILKIDYVNPDCTCTDFYVSKPELQPGDTGYIVLEMNTKDKVGKNVVSATIRANTKEKFYKISLEANVPN